jgi:hypothetical protein
METSGASLAASASMRGTKERKEAMGWGSRTEAGEARRGVRTLRTRSALRDDM